MTFRIMSIKMKLTKSEEITGIADICAGAHWATLLRLGRMPQKAGPEEDRKFGGARARSLGKGLHP
jgi:hypothetical protein